MDTTEHDVANKGRRFNVFSAEKNAINLLLSSQEDLIQKITLHRMQLSDHVAFLREHVVRLCECDELRQGLMETIQSIEQTVDGLSLHLEFGCVQLDNARRMTRTLTIKFIVVGFFESLSSGRVAEAFLKVADDVKWWTPVGSVLTVDKQRMIKRMEGSSRLGMVFDIIELIVMEAQIAVRVMIIGGRKRRSEGFQFLFQFLGEVIVAVRESADLYPLADLFNS